MNPELLVVALSHNMAVVRTGASAGAAFLLRTARRTLLR